MKHIEDEDGGVDADDDEDDDPDHCLHLGLQIKSSHDAVIF